MANQGITAYGEQQYEVAMAGLLGAAEYGDVIGIEDSMYLFFGAQAALMEKEYETAEEAFKKCVALNYNTAESVGFLSTAMKEQGKMEEAEKELAAAVALYPDNLDILIQAVNFYIDQGKNEEAEKSLSAAIKLAPDNTALVLIGNNQDALSYHESKLSTIISGAMLMSLGVFLSPLRVHASLSSLMSLYGSS